MNSEPANPGAGPALRQAYAECPLCGTTDIGLFGETDATQYAQYVEPLPKDFRWMRCGRCGHVFTAYYWTEAGLQILLGQTFAHQVANDAGDPEVFRQLWAPVVEAVVTMLGEREDVLFGTPRNWLDVGCGDGGLVRVATEFGFNAAGLDLRADPVAALQARGYSALQGEFSRLQITKSLDVISLMDVLEHMPFPIPALVKAHRALAPGGVLLLSCPNVESASWRALDHAGANPYWVELEHYHNFSRSLLVKVLRRCGFIPVNYGISKRYKAGMDLFCRRAQSPSQWGP